MEVEPNDELAALSRSWVRSLRARNRSASTIRLYVETVNQFAAHLRSEGRPTDPAAIEQADVEKFMITLLETRSAGTARVRFAALRTFFQWALDEGEIDASPMAKMVKPAPAERPVPVFSDDELQRLFATVDGHKGFLPRRDAALLRMFAASGVRLGEAVGMRVDDVDLDERTVAVIGKGNRGRVVSFDPKTGVSLDRYLRERTRHRHRGEPWLWLGPKGRLSDSGIRQVFRRRADEAGVAGMHPHRFRHTFAHKWLAAGGTEGGLQSMAGWQSNQMIGRYGASAQAQRARDEYDRLRLGHDM